LQGAFEFHHTVAAEGAQVCAVERFSQQIKSELMAGSQRVAIHRPNPENRGKVFDLAGRHLAILSLDVQPAKQEKIVLFGTIPGTNAAIRKVNASDLFRFPKRD